MVINLRGTHGSGKTYVCERLIERYDLQPVAIDGGPCASYGYVGHGRADVGVGVISCDRLRSPDHVCQAVREFNEAFRLVVFEGIIVSDTYQRYADLAVELGEGFFVFYFMNTPLDVCIARVEQRVLKRNRPLNVPLITKKFDRVARVRERAEAAGLNVRSGDGTELWR